MSNTEGANTHCIRRKKWNPRDPPDWCSHEPGQTQQLPVKQQRGSENN